MNRPRLAHFSEGTDALPGAVDRLRLRLGTVPHPVLDALAHPPPGAIRLGRPRGAGFNATPVRLLLAALLLFTLRPVPLERPLDVHLASTERVEERLTASVVVGFAGEGQATGTDRSPRVRWWVGVLDVEVAPGQGVDLVVETPEGTATVVGTGFAVDRSRLGTEVRVRHGAVRVACVAAPSVVLQAGESAWCLPTTALGWLGRAQALAATDPQSATEAGEAGLAVADGPERGELVRVIVSARLALGDVAGARAAAGRYPADGPRAEAMQAIVDGR